MLHCAKGVTHCRYSLLPLHSMVPAAEQRRVFVRPPAGIRKIVLATNIGGLTWSQGPSANYHVMHLGPDFTCFAQS